MMSKNLEQLVPIDIPSCLRGISYPAGKKELLQGARLNRAPFQVLQVLRRIPEAEYHGLGEVLKNYKHLICSTCFPAIRN